MDAAQVLQTVLSVIQSQNGGGDAGANATVAAVSSASSQSSASAGAPLAQAALAAGSLSLPQLLFALVSSSAVRDWVKLLLVGAFFETCRRLLTKVWEDGGDYLWLTATFEWDDETSEWISYWLSKRKVFSSARTIEVTSWCYGLNTTTIEGLDDGGMGEDGRVSFIPSRNKAYSLWYKGRYMTFKREKQNDGGYYGRPTQVLIVRILSRDPKLLRDLIVEARREYKEARKDVINVYVAEGSDRWKHVAKQDKRPTRSVILDPGVFELVLDDAQDFLRSRQWYADRGIPFRRGYLLYGAPGAGKTSMIHSIAGELGLNIYILSLTVMSLDDNGLKALIGRLPAACIVLIEDIDAAFHRGMKRNINDPEKQARLLAAQQGREYEPPQGQEDGEKAPDMFVNGVTLSGLLNALDGIAAQEGRILFATTNDYSALDPALLRPGRLDLHIEFHLASEYQARELFTRFYTPADGSASSETKDVDEKGGSGAACSSSSGDGDDNGTAGANKESGKGGPQAGNSMPAASSEAQNDLPESVHTVYVGMSRKSAGLPRLTVDEVDELANRFAAAIPPRTFSMATLQGYLMAYKVRPLEAVADAPAWVEKRLQEKLKATAVSSSK
ncbi:P-loop containing nucleoside triphosphate hydrolase protein [Cubamyces sp. BRFM 1775]|nr:P-loop containing nucleoside triphosphate hydrolase protein [Cubamyces sp. BRFM 1775]